MPGILAPRTSVYPSNPSNPPTKPLTSHLTSQALQAQGTKESPAAGQAKRLRLPQNQLRASFLLCVVVWCSFMHVNIVISASKPLTKIISFVSCFCVWPARLLVLIHVPYSAVSAVKFAIHIHKRKASLRALYHFSLERKDMVPFYVPYELLQNICSQYENICKSACGKSIKCRRNRGALCPGARLLQNALSSYRINIHLLRTQLFYAPTHNHNHNHAHKSLEKFIHA
ncbi:hypothetical protein EYC84_002730 [Monilinia fructicola]|uniref:Uncharacterized protein n=1 Tax=Monilinia fructicola TaxID=38448 RepID=A0A5M9JUC7_MONFR|nr:hypothetical protein EYC84_002730 [Monilinia fructicola]